MARLIPRMKKGGPLDRPSLLLQSPRSARQDEEPVRPKDNRRPADQRKIGQETGFSFAQIAIRQAQILQRFGRELAAVLQVMAEPEYRQDQRGKDHTRPERILIAPDLRPCPKEQRVDESQNRVQPDQEGRGLPRGLHAV